jgi:hypothetical protein
MMTPTSKKKNKPNTKPLINLQNKNTEANKKALAAKKKQRTAAEMGSKPVQERDTGPGGMTATGPKKRLGKAVATNQKKFGTRVGTGSVSARNAKKKLRK